VDWIELTEGRTQWRDLVLNVLVPEKAVKFFDRLTIDF
jgi:hypothetical protein